MSTTRNQRADSINTARILYVDDDPESTKAFRRAFCARGFVIDVAHGAHEAVQLASCVSYPVVATDLDMPRIDGLGLIDALGALLPTTTFLLVTGAANRRELNLPTQSERARSIAGVIHKPWDPDEVEQVLQLAIRLHRARIASTGGLRTPPPLVRVLVVEDNPGDALLLRRRLSCMGECSFSVVVVERLADALSMLGQRTFDAIVADLTLPDARGIDAVTRLQRMAPHLPVIVMSGSSEHELALEAVQLGAQDYIVKGRDGQRSLSRVIQYAMERKRFEERLAHMAHHDQLTGLANRTLFRERVNQSLRRARKEGTRPAVLLLDLDEFKQVNDTLGHEAGDELLVEAGAALLAAAEDTATVARLGGDEFAVLVEDMDDEERASKFAARLLDAIERVPVPGLSGTTVTASIGIAIHPQNGKTIQELLRSGDAAMYRAKHVGRNNYQFYDKRMHERAARRVQLAREIRGASTRDEFELFFQPQSAVASGESRSCEALLRWHHPRFGIVPPREFIPILEESGDIVDVGAWVFDAACSHAHRWSTKLPGDIRVAVNVSPRQFDDEGLVDKVDSALRAHELAPECLELEITERLLLRDLTRAEATIRRLKRLGVRIAMDDFGIGYSHLANLVRFPFDVLKLDRTVVGTIGRPDGDSVVTAVIELAHTLGLEVVAEGIEEPEQLAFLCKRSCDLYQGHLLARPMNAASCQRWMERARSKPPARIALGQQARIPTAR